MGVGMGMGMDCTSEKVAHVKKIDQTIRDIKIPYGNSINNKLCIYCLIDTKIYGVTVHSW